MSKRFLIQVFGKPGCDKCKMLNRRLDKLLAKKLWGDFEKQYFSVETEEGMTMFCEAECINPQRIPAMLIKRRNEESGEFEPVPNLHAGEKDEVCRKSRLYQYLGIQTDYTEDGHGVITPKMISAVLEETLAQ